MSMFSKLEGLRSTVRSGTLSRLLAVLLGGSLNQKAVAVLGLFIILGSIYYALVELWAPVLCGIVGAVFCYLAMSDYERTGGTRM